MSFAASDFLAEQALLEASRVQREALRRVLGEGRGNGTFDSPKR